MARVTTKHAVLLGSSSSPGWRRGSVVKTSVSGWRTFLALCLIYSWHVTTSWVSCLLWVNKPGQLSLPSFGVGKWVVIHELHGLRGWGRPVWLMLVGRRSVCDRTLSLRSIGCTPTVCDMNIAAAAAVCGFWRYTSVICLCLAFLFYA